MAPSYANSFMDVLEESILSSAPDNKTPAFYRRFIDVGWLLWKMGLWRKGSRPFCRTFWQCPSQYSVHILVWQVCELLGHHTETINGSAITSDLFTKETDMHQYLLPTSDHQPHVHRHLLRCSSEGHRLRLREVGGTFFRAFCLFVVSWLEHSVWIVSRQCARKFWRISRKKQTRTLKYIYISWNTSTARCPSVVPRSG